MSAASGLASGGDAPQGYGGGAPPPGYGAPPPPGGYGGPGAPPGYGGPGAPGGYGGAPGGYGAPPGGGYGAAPPGYGAPPPPGYGGPPGGGYGAPAYGGAPGGYGGGAAGGPGDLFSPRQVEEIVVRANRKVDIPFISEGSEAQIVRAAVQTINPKIEPALRTFLPPDVVNLIRTLVDDRIPVDVKKRETNRLLQLLISPGLTAGLGDDFRRSLPPMVPEPVTRSFASKVVEEAVQMAAEKLVKGVEATGMV